MAKQDSVESSGKTDNGYYSAEESGDLKIRPEGMGPKKDDKEGYTDDELLKDELEFIYEHKKDRPQHIKTIRDTLNADAADLADQSTPYLTGLAFSGGGIRSAIFSLGVAQKFAKVGIFQQADYLSTVSGGGFIGSALAWWRSDRAFGDETADDVLPGFNPEMPYGTADPRCKDEDEPAPLKHLRRNGKYLVPGNGVNLVSGLAVLGRTVLLNLFVWIPMITALFLLLHWVSNSNWIVGIPNIFTRNGRLAYNIMITGAALAFLIYILHGLIYSASTFRKRGKESPKQIKRDVSWVSKTLQRIRHAKGVNFYLGVLGIASLFVVYALGLLGLAAIPMAFVNNGWDQYSHIANYVLPDSLVNFLNVVFEHRDVFFKYVNNSPFIPIILIIFIAFAGWKLGKHILAALFAVAALLLFAGGVLASTVAFLMVVIPFIWLAVSIGRWFSKAARRDGLSVSYSDRRFFEEVYGWALKVAAIAFIIGTVPYVVQYLGNSVTTGAGAGAGVGGAGVVGGIASALWGFVRTQSGKGNVKFTRLILAAGSVLLFYGFLILGYALSDSLVNLADSSLETKGWIWTGYWLALFIAVFTGWRVNLNHISLGRFYRDRLMEAFLPDAKTVLEPLAGEAPGADGLKMSDLWEKGKASGPLPIINTNTVLINSKNRKYRVRGGDNFAITPFYCGGNATGWSLTEKFDNNQMTLASAMATSGAAANPRAGAGGKGITKNVAVSMVMSLLNFRLGYWVIRPDKVAMKWWQQRASHFYPSAYYSIPGVGYEENARYQELSDGAHFENLGVYELVRRRCGLIFVCDGGQDVQASYADFVTFIQRVGEDFGARVVFEEGQGPEKLISNLTPGSYPKGAEYAEKGYFVASIDYGSRGRLWPTPERGLVVYLKTTMINELSMSAKGYKGANEDFPDQTTSDQFFDEEQFEAYRELGYRTACTMIEDLGLEEAFKQGRRPDWNLTFKQMLKEDDLDPSTTV